MSSFLLETGADEAKVGDVTSLAYGAGSDTVRGFGLDFRVTQIYSASKSVSSISTFILAMCNHPEIQAKAQGEIDTVVGHERLPDFGDRENLPYVNAVIFETLRWHPVTPFGTPASEVFTYPHSLTHAQVPLGQPRLMMSTTGTSSPKVVPWLRIYGMLL